MYLSICSWSEGAKQSLWSFYASYSFNKPELCQGKASMVTHASQKVSYVLIPRHTEWSDVVRCTKCILARIPFSTMSKSSHFRWSCTIQHKDSQHQHAKLPLYSDDAVYQSSRRNEATFMMWKPWKNWALAEFLDVGVRRGFLEFGVQIWCPRPRQQHHFPSQRTPRRHLQHDALNECSAEPSQRLAAACRQRVITGTVAPSGCGTLGTVAAARSPWRRRHHRRLRRNGQRRRNHRGALRLAPSGCINPTPACARRVRGDWLQSGAQFWMHYNL